MILNRRVYTIYNLGERGVGWTFDDAGQPQLLDSDGDATTYETTQIYANIQPYLGRKAQMENGGTATVNRIKGYVGKDNDGNFPSLDVADNDSNTRGTLVVFLGEYYEIVLSKTWALGLIPHMYFEAELLARDLTNGGGTDVEW